MERRNYATILILVFGIVQTHSYPQAQELSSLESVENSIQDEPFGYLDTINFDKDIGHIQDGERVKRERPLEPSEILEREYKLDRRLTAAIRARNIDSAERSFYAALARFHSIIDTYIAQGYSQAAAMNLFQIRYPQLTNQIVGYQGERH